MKCVCMKEYKINDTKPKTQKTHTQKTHTKRNKENKCYGVFFSDKNKTNQKVKQEYTIKNERYVFVFFCFFCFDI